MRLWNLAVVLKDRAAWQRLSKHPPRAQARPIIVQLQRAEPKTHWPIRKVTTLNDKPPN